MKYGIFVLAFAVSGCVINADMDRYAAPLTGDQLLDMAQIQGPPGGDLFTAPTFDAFMADSAEIGGRALFVNGVVTMRAASHSRPDRYEVTWRGIRSAGQGGATTIMLRDAQGRAVAGVRIDQQEIAFLTGEDDDAPVQTPLSNGAHDITIGVSKGVAGNVDLRVEYLNGNQPVNWPNIDPIDGSFSKLHTVTVETDGGVSYGFDDMVAWLRN